MPSASVPSGRASRWTRRCRRQQAVGTDSQADHATPCPDAARRGRGRRAVPGLPTQPLRPPTGEPLHRAGLVVAQLSATVRTDSVRGGGGWPRSSTCTSRVMTTVRASVDRCGRCLIGSHQAESLRRGRPIPSTGSGEIVALGAVKVSLSSSRWSIHATSRAAVASSPLAAALRSCRVA